VSDVLLARASFLRWQRVPRLVRQICVAIAGTAVLLVGLAMIVLPGPAVLVLPLGLAILGTEFSWARKLLQAAKAALLRWKAVALQKLRARRRGPGGPLAVKGTVPAGGRWGRSGPDGRLRRPA
jgi:uncharacterized protein (TIGR02611 family)